MIRRNPVASVKSPRVVKKEVVPPDVQAVRDLLQLAEREQHPLFAFIHLLVHTGMRRGEALALRWSSVNLEEGWLQVVEHVTRTHHQGVIVDTPKTTAGVRVIDLDKLTVKVLRRHQDAQVQAGDSELVFPHGDGGFMKEAGIMRDLKELGQRVGVPGITWHQLRHLHASLALQNKQNVATVSRRLGHSKTSITLDTYSHMLPGWQQEVADAVAGAIAEDPPEGPRPTFPGKRRRRSARKRPRRSLRRQSNDDGEGYDRGADVVHQELRSWRPGQHGPECVCECCVTARVLRNEFFVEAIEIINEAAAQHRLKGHAGLE